MKTMRHGQPQDRAAAAAVADLAGSASPRSAACARSASAPRAVVAVHALFDQALAQQIAQRIPESDPEM